MTRDLGFKKKIEESSNENEFEIEKIEVKQKKIKTSLEPQTDEIRFVKKSGPTEIESDDVLTLYLIHQTEHLKKYYLIDLVITFGNKSDSYIVLKSKSSKDVLAKIYFINDSYFFINLDPENLFTIDEQPLRLAGIYLLNVQSKIKFENHQFSFTAERPLLLETPQISKDKYKDIGDESNLKQNILESKMKRNLSLLGKIVYKIRELRQGLINLIKNLTKKILYLNIEKPFEIINLKRRCLSFLLVLFLSFGIELLLKESNIYNSYLSLDHIFKSYYLGQIVSKLNIEFIKNYYANFINSFPFLIFIGIEILSVLILGRSVGDKLLKIKNYQAHFIEERFKGFIKIFIQLFTMPILIFDFITIFKIPSIKEILVRMCLVSGTQNVIVSKENSVNKENLDKNLIKNEIDEECLKENVVLSFKDRFFKKFKSFVLSKMKKARLFVINSLFFWKRKSKTSNDLSIIENELDLQNIDKVEIKKNKYFQKLKSYITKIKLIRYFPFNNSIFKKYLYLDLSENYEIISIRKRISSFVFLLLISKSFDFFLEMTFLNTQYSTLKNLLSTFYLLPFSFFFNLKSLDFIISSYLDYFPLLTFLFLELFFITLFGRSAGDLVLKIENYNLSPIESRFKGVLKLIIHIYTLPFLVFDIVSIFKIPTFKEIVFRSCLVIKKKKLPVDLILTQNSLEKEEEKIEIEVDVGENKKIHKDLLKELQPEGKKTKLIFFIKNIIKVTKNKLLKFISFIVQFWKKQNHLCSIYRRVISFLIDISIVFSLSYSLKIVGYNKYYEQFDSIIYNLLVVNQTILKSFFTNESDDLFIFIDILSFLNTSISLSIMLIVFCFIPLVLGGVTIGQTILKIKTEGSFVSKTIKGFFRATLGFLFFPNIIFDLSLFFRFPTFKEVFSGSYLIHIKK